MRFDAGFLPTIAHPNSVFSLQPTIECRGKFAVRAKQNIEDKLGKTRNVDAGGTKDKESADIYGRKGLETIVEGKQKGGGITPRYFITPSIGTASSNKTEELPRGAISRGSAGKVYKSGDG